MDKDRDSRLGNNDFAESVREDPLLLSCFGQIFPSSRVSIIQKKIQVLDRFFLIHLEKSGL